MHNELGEKERSQTNNGMGSYLLININYETRNIVLGLLYSFSI